MENGRREITILFGAGVKLGVGRVRGRVQVVDQLNTNLLLTERVEQDVQVSAGLSVGLP
jgi:hypothetical protein